jgi:hypothetical protein
MCRRFVVALLLASVVRADAQTPEQARLVLNNVQHEMIECAAYYTIMQTCIGKERDPALYETTAKIVTKLHEQAFDIGRRIGLTRDATLSRVKMSMESQMGLMNKDCINTSSLLSRYAARCKVVFENPDKIVDEYLKR